MSPITPAWLQEGGVPTYFWQHINNHHKYLDWLGQKLGYTKMEDWYKVNQKAFYNNHGLTLLKNYYSNSPSKAIMQNYSFHPWEPFRFTPVPHGFWNDFSNHTKYMEWLGRQLGYGTMEDWYRVEKRMFYKNLGCGFLQGWYGDSPSAAVAGVFKHHQWDLFKFNIIPSGYWTVQENQKRYMKWLGGVLGFKNMKDWYSIDRQAFQRNFGARFLKNEFGSNPSDAVMEVFGNHKWVAAKFLTAPTRQLKQSKSSWFLLLGLVHTHLGSHQTYDWRE